MKQETLDKLKKFRDDRNWEKFHTNENLAKAISIEANEVLELFLWNNEFNKENLEDEIADVASYLYLLADKNNIDIDVAIQNKIERNQKRFPIEKNQGKVNKDE